MFRYLYHLLVYGNIWIALGASLMSIMHFQWTNGVIDWTYIFTLFGASVFLYAIHRKVGLDENSRLYDIRFDDFIKMSKESDILGIAGFIITLVFGVFLPFEMVIWFAPAIVLSTLYVMPLGKKKLRLRDYGIIKIPVQSLIWAWLIVIIPQVLSSNELSGSVWLIFFEKFLFLFAITIPFDIRDMKVDSAQGVKTIPQIIGKRNALLASYLMITLCIVIVFFLYFQNTYDQTFFAGLVLSYLTTLFLLLKSKNREKDYWFSFLLDGTLVVQPLWVLLML